MAQLTLYIKPTCKTCQKIMDHLDTRGVNYDKVDFFKKPFMIEELKRLFNEADIKPSQALRKKDKMYKELKLDEKRISEEGILELMIKHPGLIIRPIARAGGKAAITRKPEEIDSFLNLIKK